MADYSSKPNKQRFEKYNMPLHLARARLSCHLSKELRKELKRRSLSLRINDVVKIMRGSHKSKTGKVTQVNLKGTAFVEKITRKKSDGTEIQVPLTVSNLLLIELDRKDKKRIKKKAA
ncbi:MAG: 50S ribosomal protein L24 [Candidatus Diapherotrites archaeon]|nr:50S ribosomal protein L24 [Candidatus Diapherotrites archaeon]